MDFVTVFESTDPIEVEMLEQFLKHESVAVRVFGTRHGAGIGAAPHILRLRVDVPSSEQERAVELIEEFFGAPDELDEDELPEELRPADEDEEDAPHAEARPRLRGLYAAGVVPLFPGAAHIYARRPWTALWVAIGEVAGLVFIVGAESWWAYMAGIFLLGGMLLYDIIGAQKAVRTFNRGVAIRRGGQVLRGLAALLLVATSAFILGRAIPWSPPEYDTSPFPNYIIDPYTGQPIPDPYWVDERELDAYLEMMEQWQQMQQYDVFPPAPTSEEPEGSGLFVIDPPPD